MEQQVEIIPRIKCSSSPNQKFIIQIRQQAMDLQKTTVHMMKREEAVAVLMRMRWVPIGIIGGSVRRAVMVIVRPECTLMARSMGVVGMSSIIMSVCGPLCI